MCIRDRRKADALWVLVLHCAITALAVAALTGWWDVRALLAFAAHLAVDGLGLGKDVWPRLMRQGTAGSDEVSLWIRLIDDQALHIVSLALISRVVV